MNLLHILQPPPHLLVIPERFAVKKGELFEQLRNKPLDNEIKEAMRGKGWLTVLDIAFLIDARPESTRRALQRMKRKEMIASKGSTKGASYLLIV